MPMFQYTAMDSAGKEKKGKIDAPSEDAVVAKLKEDGMFPTSIKAAKGKSSKKKGSQAGGGSEDKKEGFSLNINLGPVVIKTKVLTTFTRQLAILLDAGLPLVRSLRTLERQSKDLAVKKIVGETASSVEGGSTFSEALAQHPRSFDKLYLNMIKAGEAAGAMEIILDRLAAFMEKAAKIAGKIKSAMIYPIVVLSIALLITAGLMLFIVPNFAKIFEDMLGGESLPALTQFVMNISDIMQNHFLKAAIVIAVMVVIFKLLKKTKQGAAAMDWVKFNIPVFGQIVSKGSISRFSRTLGTLMASGVPVLNALMIVRDTAGNTLVSNAVQKVHNAVKEGEGIAGPLSATNIFPDMVISMIEVGEETGKLPEMLEKIADTYDEEVDNLVGSMTSLIEPFMIIFLAAIVGTIVVAMFMPLISIIDKLG